ncbi:calcium-binding protein (plasmid) [Paracoccus versutus]|uniref:calcium-binding protein n=1 Tax=Paracoccus versutus TaxID=34007 RepID=UPI0023D7C52E|nr:calcium-binding protein [Paracoccus versutus]WEJ80124.1 calcium-binding protein [Paracoccus versutus]
MFEEVEAVAMAAGDGLAHSGRGAWRSYNFEVEDLHTYVAGGVRVHNDSQATIDLAGNLGRSFGTQLANVLLEGESQFERLLGGTILGTITENLAEVITSTGYHMFDGRQLNFAVSLEDAIDNQLGDIGPELTASLTASMASLFAAELGEQLGLEGFGAQLFGVTASTYAGSVIEQLAKQNYNWGEVKWGNAWDSVPGAVGAFFGSSLAHKILPADTLAGSIGGSLGSIAGTSWAIGQIGGALGGMQSVGLLGNLLIPGVGAFIGTLLGDLFGDDPEPGANFLMFAEQQGENIIPGVLDYYLYATARDGFPHDYTEALGEAVIDLSRAYMSNIGAFDMANANISNFTLPAIYQNNDPHHLGPNPLVRVLQRMNIEAQDNGSLRFYVNGRRVDSAEAMVDGAVTDFLRDSQPIGGNIFLKRAVANSAGDASFTLAASMATAAEYERYLEDHATINALIAASPDSAFSGAWAYTLAGAEQLRLGRVSQVDFDGGLGGFLASLVEAGVAVDFTGTTVQRGTNGKVLVNVTVEDADSIPSHIKLFAHGARVTETADGATIQFTFNSNMAAVGYKNLMSSTAISGTNRHDVSGESNGRDLWIAADNRNYNFTDIGTHTIRVGDAEIESSDDILIAGGGNDSIQAGTGWDWISGGAGNDTLHGGDQDDTIFGGAGNDLIYGGHQMDYLEGGAGADTIYGTAQGDSGQQLDPLYHATDYATAGYRTSNAGVNINLGAGTASGGHATGDKLHYIINLVGSDRNDTLVGSGISNWLEGGAGADILDGGNDTLIPPGLDTVPPDYASYFHAPEGVTASLANPNINTGDASGDVYRRIEGLQGSNFDGILIGDGNDNFLMGMAGDDILVVGHGEDSVRGGFGFDIMSYRDLGSGIKMDLANWAASSAVVKDDKVNEADIEGYEGTNHNDTLLGSAQGDVLIGRAGNDSIEGRQGDDALIGDAGNDTLNGGAGADSMTGGDGNDVYLVDNAGDVISETADGGTDRIHASIGIDLNGRNGAYRNVENVSLAGIANLLAWGSAANNSLTGNNGNNNLAGRNGNDMLNGGLGNDTLNGGAGIDTAVYAGTAAIRVNLGQTTAQATGQGMDILIDIENVTSGSGNDTLFGNDGANNLSGAAGNDSLVGGAGNDTLNGGAGADMMTGGAGNDVFWIDSSDDRVIEVAGGGTDQINASIGIDLDRSGGIYANIENVALQGTGNLNARGSAASNIMVGNAGNNILDGRDGDDSLKGGAGADTLDGGNGNDILDGGTGADRMAGRSGNDVYWVDASGDVIVEMANGGTDRINASIGIDLKRAGDVYANVEEVWLQGSANIGSWGSAANDRLVGNSGANVLNGREGNDLVEGGAGNDSLWGDVGNDTLNGGTGADSMNGGAGNDVYWVDNAGDVLVEAANGGTDRINATIGIDLSRSDGAYAEVENVSLMGAANLNTYGSGANNVLIGNEGANILAGRTGNDNLTGAAGADTFLFRKGWDRDTVLDFEDNVDTVRLLDFDVTAFAEARTYATQSGADVVFDFGDGDTLTIRNITISALADNMIFV